MLSKKEFIQKIKVGEISLTNPSILKLIEDSSIIQLKIYQYLDFCSYKLCQDYDVHYITYTYKFVNDNQIYTLNCEIPFDNFSIPQPEFLAVLNAENKRYLKEELESKLVKNNECKLENSKVKI